MRVALVVLLMLAAIPAAMAKRKPDAPVDAGPPPASFDDFTKLATPVLLAGFFDPDSAKITWDRGLMSGYWKMFLSKRIVGWMTCGLVNGKNQYGGYAGARRFVAVYYGGKIIYTDVGDGSEYDITTSTCNKAISSGLLPPAPGK